MEEADQKHRPGSHKVLTWIFGFVFFILIGVPISEHIRHVPNSFLKNPTALLMIILGSVAFLAIKFAGRRSWTYYTVSLCLFVWIVRVIQTTIFAFSYGSAKGPPVAYIGGPDMRWISLLFDLALISLFWRYTFGKASREYYALSGSKRANHSSL